MLRYTHMFFQRLKKDHDVEIKHMAQKVCLQELEHELLQQNQAAQDEFDC